MHQVIVSYGAECVVRDGPGPLQRCRVPAGGRRSERPVCGDRVLLEDDGAGPVVAQVLERDNVIERGDFRGRPRPLAANVDRLIIVTAEPPGIDPLLIDRYLVLAAHLGVSVVLWVNKADRLDARGRADCEAQLAPYRQLGHAIHWVSTLGRPGLDGVRGALAGHTSILVGHSGVGKSSLVNALLPDLDLRIGALSEAGGQGRHTTTTTTLFALPDGGEIIDSPGVRTLRLDHLPAAAVLEAFPEISRHTGRCRFRDCRHRVEPGCAVLAALDEGSIDPGRFENFRTLLAESGGTGDA